MFFIQKDLESREILILTFSGNPVLTRWYKFRKAKSYFNNFG